MNTVADRQKAWREEKRKVRQLKDKLGRTVDKEIIETVAVLRLLGFDTIGSCSGHLRRVTDGPYVIFESPQARRYAVAARRIADTKDEEYRKLRKKANYFRVLDLRRMSDYLESFYDGRPLNYGGHLIVQSMPMTLNIIKCHGAEIMRIADTAGKKEILKDNQKEIRAFTAYLKDKYFKQD